jgi:hypothetical protein
MMVTASPRWGKRLRRHVDMKTRFRIEDATIRPFDSEERNEQNVQRQRTHVGGRAYENSGLGTPMLLKRFWKAAASNMPAGGATQYNQIAVRSCATSAEPSVRAGFKLVSESGASNVVLRLWPWATWSYRSSPHHRSPSATRGGDFSPRVQSAADGNAVPRRNSVSPYARSVTRTTASSRAEAGPGNPLETVAALADPLSFPWPSPWYDYRKCFRECVTHSRCLGPRKVSKQL